MANNFLSQSETVRAGMKTAALQQSSLSLGKPRSRAALGRLFVRMLAVCMATIIAVDAAPAILSTFTNFDGSSDVNAAAWTGSIPYSKLGKTYTGIDSNFVPFKTFYAENNPTGSSFQLLEKYKSGGAFNPSAYTIVIEDDADLRNWSIRCYSAAEVTEENKVYLKANYILGNNIDFKYTDSEGVVRYRAGIIPIGIAGRINSEAKFVGSFNGQGFEISNLTISDNIEYYYYSETTCRYAGMFANIGTAGEVRNLGLNTPSYYENTLMGFGFYVGSLAGYNEGLIERCFVNSTGGAHRFTNPNVQIAGLVHTNAGRIDSVYTAGKIRLASHTSQSYNPVVYTAETGSNITQAYYDSATTVYDGGTVTEIPGVSGVTTSVLQNRTDILQHEQWYTNNYSRTQTTLLINYPRLCGFKTNVALVNSATNYFEIAQPADFIFMNQMIDNSATTATFASTARYYRLRNCLNMYSLSRTAWVTSVNNFNGTLSGTVANGADCTCGSVHPGGGTQKKGHSIVGMQMTVVTASEATQVLTQRMFMGLFYSASGTTSPVFRDINMVGGQIVIPAIDSARAASRSLYVGAFGGYLYRANFMNVHTSMDIITIDNTADNYLGHTVVGGLCGYAYYASTTSGTDPYNTMSNCSSSGEIDMGTHRYAPPPASGTYYFYIGGLCGQTASSGTTYMRDTTNYGKVTGISFTDSTNGTVPNEASIGGIIGYSGLTVSLQRVANFADIIPVRNAEGGVFSGGYQVGGIAGYTNRASARRGTEYETYDVYNKGSIYAYPVADSGKEPVIRVAGLFGAVANNTSDTSTTLEPYAFSRIDNEGDILLSPKLIAVAAASFMNGDMVSIYDSVNTGRVLGENGGDIVLSPKYKTAIFGLAGGFGAATSTYATYRNIISNCVNEADIHVKLQNATMTGSFLLGGISSQSRLEDCRNEGNITMEVSNSTISSGNYLRVTGGTTNAYSAHRSVNNATISLKIENSTMNTTLSGLLGETYLDEECVNKGAVNYYGYNHTMHTDNMLTVAGLGFGSISGSSLENVSRKSVNEGKVTVERVALTKTTSGTTYQSIILVGIRRGAASYSKMEDCENKGELLLDFYYEDETPVLRNTNASIYVSGISHNALSMSRCVNNGNITVANQKNLMADNIYVSGISYLASATSSSNFMDSCVNKATLTHKKNIGVTNNTLTNTTTVRNIMFSGIVYQAPVHFTHCVNEGDIILRPTATENNRLDYYNISGVCYTTASIDTSRTSDTFGIRNLGNSGKLIFDHAGSVMPAKTRVNVSGIANRFGVGNTSYVGFEAVPLENMVNVGNIEVLVDSSGGDYNATTPSAYYYLPTNAAVAVGGISASPGANTSTGTGNTSLANCANLGSITVDTTRGATSSSTLVCQVGGILANNASSTYALAAQKLSAVECVNGGTITVRNQFNPTTENIYQSYSGVGGIMGYGAQTCYSVTAEQQAAITAGVYNCTNFATVSGGIATGGIVGADGSIIQGALNFGTIISANGGNAGGILGALRSSSKTNSTYHMLRIENTMNYGNIVATGTVKAGGIVGSLALAQVTNAGLANRTFRNLLNAANAAADGDQSAVPMFGDMVAQIKEKTVIENAYEIANGSTFSARSSSNYNWFITNFPGAIQNKSVEDPSDGTSIYSDDFQWMSAPPSNIAYIPPEKSERNEEVPLTSPVQYSPHKYGIYGLTTDLGVYPSANISLSRINPQTIGDASTAYTDWQKDAASKLAGCRQIRVTSETGIEKLELVSAATPTVYLRSAEVDTASKSVYFYIIKDNYHPGEYFALSSAQSNYTVLMYNSEFAPGQNNPIIFADGLAFDGGIKHTAYLELVAGDGESIETWKLVFIFKKDCYPAEEPHENGYPLEMVDIWESQSSITNASANYNRITTPQRDGDHYRLEDAISNDTTYMIFWFYTTDLLTGVNRVNDVWLEKSDGTTVPTSSGSYSYYGKTTTTAQLGITALNYKVLERIDDPETYVAYKDYTGRMTVNMTFYNNLPSGEYRVVINTVYGPTYIYFRREPSPHAAVTSAGFYLVSGTLSSAYVSINSNESLIYNSATNIPYGNAPDLQRLLTQDTTTPLGIFSTLTISNGATAGPQRLVSVEETNPGSGDGAKTYTIAFTVTAEAGNTRDWKVRIMTRAAVPELTTITANFKGKDYSTAEVKNPDIQNEQFFINEFETLNFKVNHDMTGLGTYLFTAININYVDYDLYRAGVLVPKAEYGSMISVTKTLNGNFLTLDVTVGSELPNGLYELRVFYTRYGAPIAIPAGLVDEAGNTYSQHDWANVPYTPFKFNKSVGRKLSYALGFTAPKNPVDLRMTLTEDGQSYTLPWERSTRLFNYAPMGNDVTSSDNADYHVHHVFQIEVTYKNDLFYASYTPDFILPAGATLYRMESDGTWVEVTDANKTVNMRNGREVLYRVYAEDMRYYQDYVLKLGQVERIKHFEIIFEYEGCTAAQAPAVATFRSIEEDENESNVVEGDFSVFSHSTKTFKVEAMPPGIYVYNVDVPYGYQATLYPGDGSSENDVIIGGQLIYGSGKFSIPNRIEANYIIRIVVKPVPGMFIPWGIRRDSRQ